LKTFVLHLDIEGDGHAWDPQFDGDDALNYLGKILFFRLSNSLNGLRSSGVNVKIQKMRCCYLLLDHSKNKVMMECIPQANEVFNEIMKPEGNKKESTLGNTVEMLTLHKCSFKPQSLLPLKLTYLNLRFVKGITFNDLFGPSGCLNSIETLKTLLYNQGELNLPSNEKVFMSDCCESLQNVEVLSICGVFVKSLSTLNCKRLMLRCNKYYSGFETEYPEMFKDVGDLVIVGNSFYQPSFMKLYNSLVDGSNNAKP